MNEVLFVKKLTRYESYAHTCVCMYNSEMFIIKHIRISKRIYLIFKNTNCIING